jgi:outer membrane protein TolC
MPVPFSQGRGEYKKVKLKQEETQILRSQKSLNIELKVKNYYNEFITLKNQVQLNRGMLTNFEKLLKAEETLFRNGESSLFLINSRENKVLETERKLIELKAKYYKTIYALQWSTGLLR